MCAVNRDAWKRFENNLRSHGIEHSRSISETRAGEQGEEYYIRYKGRREFLEWHLKKGTSRDGARDLRIYFFWDGEDEEIVILASFLDTWTIALHKRAPGLDQPTIEQYAVRPSRPNGCDVCLLPRGQLADDNATQLARKASPSLRIRRALVRRLVAGWESAPEWDPGRFRHSVLLFRGKSGQLRLPAISIRYGRFGERSDFGADSYKELPILVEKLYRHPFLSGRSLPHADDG